MSLTCKICDSPLSQAFSTLILGKYDATFNTCENCGFICAENPHWLEEAYSSAIASTDTGLVSRNINIANKLAVVLYLLLSERGNNRYVDVAGGYGMLTRLMRDYGFDFYWSDKYCQNLMARGFNYSQELGPCRAVTAFEVLEHTEDPVGFVKDALCFGQTDTLIFSTDLYEGNPPPPGEWWYYSFETGQHIAFFKRKTLQTVADKLGLNFYSNGAIHILTRANLNNVLLKVYSGRWSLLIIWWVRLHLKSRRISDSNAIVEQLIHNRS